MKFADVLESYLIPATESMGENPFSHIFFLGNEITFINPTMKIKGKVYNFRNPCPIYAFMKTILRDNWSEKDFLKAIENNIVYDDKDEHYYQVDYIPGDIVNNNPLIDTGKEISRKEDWDSLQCIPFYYESDIRECLFYSKAKHMFILCDTLSYQENLDERSITWGRALKEIKKDLDINANLPNNKKFAEKLIKNAELSEMVKVFIDERRWALGLVMLESDYENLGNNAGKFANILRKLAAKFDTSPRQMKEGSEVFFAFFPYTPDL